MFLNTLLSWKYPKYLANSCDFTASDLNYAKNKKKYSTAMSMPYKAGRMMYEGHVSASHLIDLKLYYITC